MQCKPQLHTEQAQPIVQSDAPADLAASTARFQMEGLKLAAFGSNDLDLC